MRLIFVYLGEDGYGMAECPYVFVLQEDNLPVPQKSYDARLSVL